LIDSLNAREVEGRRYLERYTPAFVRESLASLAPLLGMYIAFTASAGESGASPIDTAGRRIGVYVDLLWKRLSDWEAADIDLLAWTTRNLLEATFWARFVTESVDNARTFLSQDEIDQKELFEAFLERQGDLTDIGHAAVAALVASVPGKRVPMRGTDTDDPLLYKECSKFIHVSAWLINNFDRHMNDDYTRLTFIAFSLSYVVAITRMLLESNAETIGVLHGAPS
jgi:hypothetical protein